MSRTSQQFRHRTCLAVVPLLLLAAGLPAPAASTCTNWEGLVFELIIPKTNVVAGEKILASIVISNSLRSECVVMSLSGDPCRAGFGEFLIVDESSGKRINCAIPMDERVHGEETKHQLIWHDAKEFAAELARGYALTNAGDYTVQATGKFRLVGPPDSYCTAITPPIALSVSAGLPTNTTLMPGLVEISPASRPPVR